MTTPGKPTAAHSGPRTTSFPSPAVCHPTFPRTHPFQPLPLKRTCPRDPIERRCKTPSQSTKSPSAPPPTRATPGDSSHPWQRRQAQIKVSETCSFCIAKICINHIKLVPCKIDAQSWLGKLGRHLRQCQCRKSLVNRHSGAPAYQTPTSVICAISFHMHVACIACNSYVTHLFARECHLICFISIPIEAQVFSIRIAQSIKLVHLYFKIGTVVH